jgi:hypothetical protein
VTVTAESTFSIDTKIDLLRKKIAALKLCVGNEVKIHWREIELRELEAKRAEAGR